MGVSRIERSFSVFENAFVDGQMEPREHVPSVDGGVGCSVWCWRWCLLWTVAAVVGELQWIGTWIAKWKQKWRRVMTAAPAGLPPAAMGSFLVLHLVITDGLLRSY